MSGTSASDTKSAFPMALEFAATDLVSARADDFCVLSHQHLEMRIGQTRGDTDRDREVANRAPRRGLVKVPITDEVEVEQITNRYSAM